MNNDDKTVNDYIATGYAFLDLLSEEELIEYYHEYKLELNGRRGKEELAAGIREYFKKKVKDFFDGCEKIGVLDTMVSFAFFRGFNKGSGATAYEINKRTP